MDGGSALFRRYFLAAALVAMTAASMAADSNLVQHCGNDFNKVTDCLSYATGKAPAPTKECCASMTAIGASDTACLCYVIELTHNGTDQIRSLGIQEFRLIQLPSICKIKNVYITDCPKLLGIPPSSPLNDIFSTNASTAPVTSAGTNSTGNDASAATGIKLPNYHLITIAFPFVFALIFSALSHIII